jgi:hypothetical protein
MANGGGGEERKYYEAIEDFIKSRGWYDRLLELQGTDKEYCIASMKVYKAGYRSGQSAIVVGALTCESVNGYKQRGREYAVAFLESLEKRYSNEANTVVPSLKTVPVASQDVSDLASESPLGGYRDAPLGSVADKSLRLLHRTAVDSMFPFLWLGRTAWSSRRFSWAFPLWGISILYNPITRVPQPRGVWSIVNVATILVIFSFVLTSRGSSQADR